MVVTFEDIVKAFADLESGRMSRENIADFAGKAMRADDQGALQMMPSDEASRIWRAIAYLSGVDIKEPPEHYLHSVEDFVDFRSSQDIPSPK